MLNSFASSGAARKAWRAVPVLQTEARTSIASPRRSSRPALSQDEMRSPVDRHRVAGVSGGSYVDRTSSLADQVAEDEAEDPNGCWVYCKSVCGANVSSSEVERCAVMSQSQSSCSARVESNGTEPEDHGGTHEHRSPECRIWTESVPYRYILGWDSPGDGSRCGVMAINDPALSTTAVRHPTMTCDAPRANRSIATFTWY